MRCRKIVILGPESTGKSTLCESLNKHFAASRPSAWVPEYAREYLTIHGMNYRYEDLITIAKGQLAFEDAATERLCTTQDFTIDEATVLNTLPIDRTDKPDPVLFIDTDMYVMKVWSEFVFGQCEPWILDQVVTRQYDGYLLCATDLPWSFDPLREYPDLENREKLFHIYKDLMINQPFPWALVNGEHEQRLAGAILSVDKMLQH